MKLIEKYETICNKIVIEFEKKQDLNFGYWIGDTIGEIAVFNDTYYFNFTDIIFDLKANQPNGKIIEWIEYIIEFSMSNRKKDYIMNYQNYCLGTRYYNN